MEFVQKRIPLFISNFISQGENMENNIKKIEELLGVDYKNWNRETIAKLVSTEEALKLFSPEMAEYLLNSRETNAEIRPIFIPIIYGMNIRAAKAEVEKALVDLNEGSKDRSKFIQSVFAMEANPNPIFKLVSYITTLATLELEENNLSDKLDSVKNTIEEVKKVLLAFDMNDGFQITVEMIDLLFPMRELYFKKHNVDILKDDKDIEAILAKLDEKTKELFDYLKKNGLDPESLAKENHNHEGHDHNHGDDGDEQKHS
jgi:hypothetical protein